MPYIFPKRKLRDQDILDVVELNEDFIPVAELASGNLNAHNITKSIRPDFRRNNSDETAYYKYGFLAQSGGANIGSASSSSAAAHLLPKVSTFANGHHVRNDNAWSVVDSDNTRLSSFSTGVATLWINAYVQYYWMGFVSSTIKRGSGTGVHRGAQRTNHMWAGLDKGNCGVQFAIRVDGRVIESTITGKRYAFEHSIEPIRSKYQRGGGMDFKDTAKDGDLKFPGPHGTWTEGATALGPAVLPVRMGCYVQVQPGDHVIDIVARRTPRLDGNTHKYDLEDTSIDDDVVIVGTRKLFAMELKRYPTATSAVSKVAVPAFESEDSVSNAEMQIERTDTIRTALNTVKKGALARGALNHYHLKSPVVTANQVTSGTSSFNTLTTMFPVRSDLKSHLHAVAFNSSSSGVGFYNLDVGAGKVEVGPGGAYSSEFDLTEKSIFIVTGNVELISLKNNTTTGGFNSSNNDGLATMANFGVIGLGYKTTGGKEFIQSDCMSFVNSFNAVTYASNPPGSPATNFGNHDKRLDESFNVPVFHVFTSTDLRTQTTGENITKFALYGAACSPGGVSAGETSLTVNMTYRRANLSVIQLYV